MSVDKICNHNVVTTEADAGLVETALRMREEHVGNVVVTEYRNGRQTPVGILTDRDILVEVVAAKVDASALTVGAVMTRDLTVVAKDNGVDFALKAMMRAGVRRVPVVDRDGSLVGILSVDDVLAHMSEQLSHLAEALRGEQRREAKQRP